MPATFSICIPAINFSILPFTFLSNLYVPFLLFGKKPISPCRFRNFGEEKGRRDTRLPPVCFIASFQRPSCRPPCASIAQEGRRDEREQIFRVRRRLDVIGAVLVDKIGAVVRLAEARLSIGARSYGMPGSFRGIKITSGLSMSGGGRFFRFVSLTRAAFWGTRPRRVISEARAAPFPYPRDTSCRTSARSSAERRH